ncbi:hypothetical protein [Nocardioides sp. zg-1228]|uniref:hypothetical protein n=1 Tax=Nocardioides sp. zg-1228 TaxID=2763008 RepID=UPI001642ABAC|nr:hypothetical protein [Nocardioides sp. zg-1228]MBC2931673.1 hypothetical protein [Nocardioides sp. zg-1228]QSF57263.1 hypothetical protein JX575_17145 [Nocardioides sp. zg-1228]
MRPPTAVTALIAIAVAAGMATPARAALPAQDPTALYPLTSGAIGAYTYDAQVGPGIGFLDEPALCTRIVFTHTTIAEPSVSEDCRRLYGDSVLRKGYVLVDSGALFAAGDDPNFINYDFYATAPKVQRVVFKSKGRGTVKLSRRNSVVHSINGERVRFFPDAFSVPEPYKGTDVKGQVKKCRTVVIKGKKKKRCSWKTVAGQSFFLLP